MNSHVLNYIIRVVTSNYRSVKTVLTTILTVNVLHIREVKHSIEMDNIGFMLKTLSLYRTNYVKQNLFNKTIS